MPLPPPSIPSFQKLHKKEKPQTSHKFFSRGFTIIRVIFHAWNIACLSDFFSLFRNKWTSAAGGIARFSFIYGRLLTRDEIHNELIMFLRLENGNCIESHQLIKMHLFCARAMTRGMKLELWIINGILISTWAGKRKKIDTKSHKRDVQWRRNRQYLLIQITVNLHPPIPLVYQNIGLSCHLNSPFSMFWHKVAKDP